jgi:hypothetical protein
MLRFGSALVAVVALGVVASGGLATASPAGKGGATVIKIEQDGHELFFSGPDTVARGDTLKVKNTTDPQKVGPHTASLIKRSEYPRTEDQLKACGHKFKGICGEIVKWHKVNLQTGEIGENPVEVGKDGWDLQGSPKHAGDSWVSEKENQSFSREVSAPAGKTLHFFCAVHPEMQFKIQVTE